MILAFLLGLTGSLGHCSGMCGGIVLLLSRGMENSHSPLAWFQVHLGRLITYTLLGLAAGFLGERLQLATEGLQLIQGGVALYAALLGIYFALALFGLAPSPENLFPGALRAWRRLFSRTSGPGLRLPILVVGMVWGLLPCGLVLAALFTAAFGANPLTGSIRMAAFGLGTLPMLLAVNWLGSRPAHYPWPRYVGAAAVLLFSVQIGLRSLAAFGLVGHFILGQVVVW